MAKKIRTSEDYERESSRSGKASGIFLIFIGIAMGIGIISSSGGEWYAMVTALIFALLFTVIGVCLIMQKKFERKKEERLADENSRESIKKRRQLEKQIEKTRQKAYHHGSMSECIKNNGIYISGGVLALLLVLTLIIWFIGYIYYILIFLDIMAVVLFIYFISGHDYKKAKKAYAEAGASEEEAEADFETGVYLSNAPYSLCIGRRYVLGNNSRSGGFTALRREEINWVFIREKIQYNYYNGVYSGKSKNYFLIFCLKDGSAYEFPCTEAGVRIGVDEIKDSSPDVILGWSDGLGEIYMQNPAEFLENSRGQFLPSPYAVQ